jgi:hypothetical protein
VTVNLPGSPSDRARRPSRPATTAAARGEALPAGKRLALAIRDSKNLYLERFRDDSVDRLFIVEGGERFAGSQHWLEGQPLIGVAGDDGEPAAVVVGKHVAGDPRVVDADGAADAGVGGQRAVERDGGVGVDPGGERGHVLELPAALKSRVAPWGRPPKSRVNVSCTVSSSIRLASPTSSWCLTPKSSFMLP